MKIVLDKNYTASLLQDRQSSGHKYTFGKLLVIGGSEEFPGAPQMTTMAAYRAGCGLVALACPSVCIPSATTISKETVYIPLPANTEELFTSLNSYSSVVVGPGIGRSESTHTLLKRIIHDTAIPTLLDADALFWLALQQSAVHTLAPLILTPHEGEMARLLNTTAKEVALAREEHALRCAQRYIATVVLKGSETIIATYDGHVWQNSTGGVNLATAGTGDILAGIIGSLLAQGYSTENACCLGVYLHSSAGDLWKALHGDRGMIATDLITLLPDAYVALQQS